MEVAKPARAKPIDFTPPQSLTFDTKHNPRHLHDSQRKQKHDLIDFQNGLLADVGLSVEYRYPAADPDLSIQSLLIFFGPVLIPRGLAFYRSLKSRPASQIHPLPTKTSYALTLLFISGLIAFFSTLPIFIPANIFRLTQSRLQTPGGVLLTRLAAIRLPRPQTRG